MSDIINLDDYREPVEAVEQVHVLACNECGCVSWLVLDNSMLLCTKCRKEAPAAEVVFTDEG